MQARAEDAQRGHDDKGTRREMRRGAARRDEEARRVAAVAYDQSNARSLTCDYCGNDSVTFEVTCRWDTKTARDVILNSAEGDSWCPHCSDTTSASFGRPEQWCLWEPPIHVEDD